MKYTQRHTARETYAHMSFPAHNNLSPSVVHVRPPLFSYERPLRLVLQTNFVGNKVNTLVGMRVSTDDLCTLSFSLLTLVTFPYSSLNACKEQIALAAQGIIENPEERHSLLRELNALCACSVSPRENFVCMSVRTGTAARRASCT